MLGLVTSPVHPSVLDCVGWVLATVLCTVYSVETVRPRTSPSARGSAPPTEPVGVRMPQVAVAVHGRCDSFIRYTQAHTQAALKLPFGRPRESFGNWAQPRQGGGRTSGGAPLLG